MKPRASRKTTTSAYRGTEQLEERLLAIEERLKQMQWSMEKMQGYNSAQKPHDPFAEPLFYPPEELPFREPPKSTSWVDGIVTLMDNPQVQRLLQKLFKGAEVKQRKKTARRPHT